MPLGIIAEAIARVEHKIDIVIRILRSLDSTPYPPMQFAGHLCPLCSKTVEYQIDIQKNVVVRKCGCSTGKQPMLIPLMPVQGNQNGNPTESGPGHEELGGELPEDRPRRKKG